MSNLSSLRASLIGRESERAFAWAVLTRPGNRLLTLTGPGGVGKTRLARALTVDLAPEFAEGVHFIPLGDLRDPDLVLSTIASTIGIHHTGSSPIAERVHAKLASAEMLLVLDNLEQVAAAASDLAAMLDACPGVRILATSRTPIHVRFERVLPVLPLPVPDLAWLPPLEHLGRNESIRLLVQRVQVVDPEFTLTEANAADLAEICARLDGLPLTIELAAARLQVLSPAALVARLASPLTVLAQSDANLPKRQETLRDTIAWSEDLVSSSSQTLFRCLSVFAGSYATEAAEAVCGQTPDCHTPSSAVLDGLTELLHAGLHYRDVVADEPRFTMPNTICEYALEKLEATGDAEQGHRRHAAYFRGMAEEAALGLLGQEQVVWLNRLHIEHDNVRGALRWAAGNDPQTHLRLAAALWRFWYLGGSLREGRRWLESALATCAGVNSVARARVLHGLGVLVWAAGDCDRALDLQNQSFALAQEIDDAWGMAAAQADRVLVTFTMGGNAARAREETEDVLDQFRALGDRYSEVTALTTLGNIAQSQGDLKEAALRFGEGLAIARQSGNVRHQALCLCNLAQIARLEGDRDQAAAHFRDSIALARHLGIRENILYGLAGIGGISLDRREFERAARLLGAAAALAAGMAAELQPMEQAQFDRDVAAVRSALAYTEYSQEWAAGWALSVDEAVAEALVGVRSAGQAAGSHGLSPREFEVLRLLVAGNSIEAIAKSLFISRQTVQTHVKHIHRKLGLRSRAAVTAFAFDHGLV